MSGGRTGSSTLLTSGRTAGVLVSELVWLARVDDGGLDVGVPTGPAWWPVPSPGFISVAILLSKVAGDGTIAERSDSGSILRNPSSGVADGARGDVAVACAPCCRSSACR